MYSGTLSKTKERQALTAARAIVRAMEAAGIDAASPPADVAEWILSASYDHATGIMGPGPFDQNWREDLFSDLRTAIEGNVREIAGDWADVDAERLAEVEVPSGKRGKISDDVWTWIRERDAAGVSRVEIARMVGTEFGVTVSPTWLYKVLGKKRAGEGKSDTRVYATASAFERARSVALSLGLTVADAGSLSALIQAIGDGSVRVIPADASGGPL